MVVLLVLPRYTRAARYLEPQAALIQHIIDRLSLKDPAKFAESMGRFEPRLRGKLTLFDTSGHVVRSNTQPDLDPPTEAELRDIKVGKWALDWGRIVVRSDDGSMIGVYSPNRPGFPWFWVLPCGAIMLLLIGFASLWFSRRLARPLEQLAVAARKFGAGDMTARAQLERDDELGDVGRAFDDMAERTASVMMAQRQLMADVSHELRTPLARIRVALELVAEDPVAASDVLSDVGIDLDEIDQLIEDILITARLDVDQARINRRQTRVDELVADAVERFSARHPGRVLDRKIENSAIECDPVLLRRALDNLLDNAAKYSDSTTTLRLIARPLDGRAVFEVVDKGIGMSAEEIERAFTPFWRADGSRTRKTGGVGLGLALARRIARAHAGDITLASMPNVGTTARLEIPL
ncbi:MAG TPA: HAMP domain-containing sensor histidine kinase [Kofleriaceae bacterium]|nr:HAMP domain-containing sensor histidine kinase [Kofleriaceae bacterium]